ncbi:uncharacterized protein METZ01_LOCUS247300, partial [marine metagenome]
VIQHVAEDDDVPRVADDVDGIGLVRADLGCADFQVVLATLVRRQTGPVCARHELHAAVVTPRRHQRRPHVYHAQRFHMLLFPHSFVTTVLTAGSVAGILVPKHLRCRIIGKL